MPLPRLWRHPHRRRRLGLALAGALVALSLAPAQGAEPQPTHGTLRVVWEQDLPPYPSGPAMDIRWASDQSVYLAWVKEGVTETALDGKFTRLRTLIADPMRRMRDFEILATSKDLVVASARFRTFIFRPAPSQPGGAVTITKIPIGIVQDLDLAGNRLLLLGNPEWSEAPAPSVAWVGPVSEHPAQDLKGLPLYDAGGAKSPGLVNCSELLLGAARFLPDGSILVVPGFQPGAHLFSSGGRLLRSWDTAALGLDALDCAHLSSANHLLFGRSPRARFDFINQHRVLEEILPLEEGPGLLIRSVKDGKVGWELKVLQSGERVLSYEVPVAGELPYDRLRGDVRGNRIVLLRAAHEFDKLAPPFRANRIIVTELPQDAGKGGAQ
jgi:hypothetical protein